MSEPTNAVPATHELDPVATTARLTAALRAEETARPDRLLDDPLAATFAGEKGRAMLSYADDGGAIAVRTHHFDSLFHELTHREGVEQMVLVAAGLDARAFRLDIPPETIVYELDRPELHELKTDLLRHAGANGGAATPLCRRVAVPVDLTKDWRSDLTAAGFDAGRPTCWLAEGLTQYLTEPEVEVLIDRITSLAAAGSHMVADFIGRGTLALASSSPMLQTFEDHGMPWQFATDNPQALFSARGWAPTTQAVSRLAEALGRPRPPMDGVEIPPEAYIVHATR